MRRQRKGYVSYDLRISYNEKYGTAHSAPCQQPAVSRSSLFVTGERPERSPYIAGRGPGPRHLRADSVHISILKRAKLQSDSDTKWPCPWTLAEPCCVVVAAHRLSTYPKCKNTVCPQEAQYTLSAGRDSGRTPHDTSVHTWWRVCHKLAKTTVLHGADHHHAHGLNCVDNCTCSTRTP